MSKKSAIFAPASARLLEKGTRLLCASVSRLWGAHSQEAGSRVWQRLRFVALQLVAFCLCVSWCESAEARTHAGLCAPTAESMEAPPPIYSNTETFALSCETPDELSKFASPVPERPLPVIEAQMDSAKATPPVISLGGARAPSVCAPHPERDRNRGVESLNRLPRPPRA